MLKCNKQMSKLQAKDVYGKIKFTFINYVIKACQDEIEVKELAHLIKNADWSRMADHILTDDNIIDYVDWSQIKPAQALRSAARYRDVAEKIPLEIYLFKISDVLSSLTMQPHLINRVRIDLENASKDEMLQLCMIGKDEILEKINLESYGLKPADKLKILKAFNFSKLSVEKTQILTKKIKDRYTIKEILFYTGDKYIDDIDIGLLANQDWVNLLKERPELVSYVNINALLKGDMYYLVIISINFPEFLQYITDDNIYKLSSLGWEKLIIKYPEQFIHRCTTSSLENSSWLRIREHYPNLVPSSLGS